jgi:hypothetical protein
MFLLPDLRFIYLSCVKWCQRTMVGGNRNVAYGRLEQSQAKNYPMNSVALHQSPCGMILPKLCIILRKACRHGSIHSALAIISSFFYLSQPSAERCGFAKCDSRLLAGCNRLCRSDWC